MAKQQPRLSKKLLGEDFLSFQAIPEWNRKMAALKTSSFQALNDQEQSHKISETFYHLIKVVKGPCFLLPAMVAAIQEIHKLKLVESYHFSQFEFWLNQFSQLSLEENYQVRAKIVGKSIPREEYQILFPVGMGKVYQGSHYVTAHGSPDLDTTVASFWGWVDAFGAKVSEHLHFWNLPGGPPVGNIEIDLLFYQMFSPNVFHSLAKTKTTLSLSSIDLVNQKGVVRQAIDRSLKTVDYEQLHQAIILVDAQGSYLGDWRGDDVEGVRRVVTLLSECLRWFAGHFYLELIGILKENSLTKKDFSQWVQKLISLPLTEALSSEQFSKTQKKHLEAYLHLVLGIQKGVHASFKEFAEDLKKLSIAEFHEFIKLLEKASASPLFDKQGSLSSDRLETFKQVECLAKALEKGISAIRSYVDHFSIAFQVKKQVFKSVEPSINYRAEVDEIKELMGDLSFLTVTTKNRHGSLEPLGVIHAGDLHRSLLGTVTLRDFCNRDETKIPSYLEVISVIDHHKSRLETFGAPLVYISDAQSSNVVCAELAFRINDRYSVNGMTLEEIQTQIKEVMHSSEARDKRILRRLLQRELASHRKQDFIDPAREYVEYLHFLYAILDDTDLLEKVTTRDVLCLVSLLNRLKSLSLKKEVEIIHLDDVPKDASFLQKAVLRILKNPDMQSLYTKVYCAKEKAVEQNLCLAAEGKESTLFLDVKVQNKCARVGQTKLFSSNLSSFKNFETKLQTRWVKEAAAFWKEHPDVDLHLQMVSTVTGATELLSEKANSYRHQDALWMWIPSVEAGIEHLKRFLSAFKHSPQLKKEDLSLEFYGEHAQEYRDLFLESFLEGVAMVLYPKKTLSLIVLRYPAGILNSRKAAISPYLPIV